MRTAPTSADRIAWEWLRGNLTGSHFRTQAVVDDYVVDFYFGLVRIAVEVDGKMHDTDGEYSAQQRESERGEAMARREADRAVAHQRQLGVS